MMVVQELLTRIGFAVDRNSMQVAVGALGHVRNKAKSARDGIMSATSQILAGFGLYKLAKAGLEAASAVETLTTEFGTMLKSGEKANKLFSDIRQMALTTPYDEIGLSKSAKILLAYGRTNDQIMSDLAKLGDIAGADTEKFQHLALVYGQIWAAGKLKGDDLRQLVNWGINPLKEYAEKMGITYMEAQDAMRRGEISSQMVMDSFTRMTSEGGLFYKNMERLSSSLVGRWNVFKGYWRQFLGEVTTQLLPSIKQILTTLASVDWKPMVERIKVFTDAINNFVKTTSFDEVISALELMSVLIVSIATKDLQVKFINAMAISSRRTLRYIDAMKGGFLSFKTIVIHGARAIGTALKSAFGPIGLALLALDAVNQGADWIERKAKARGEQANVDAAWNMMHGIMFKEGYTAEQLLEQQRSRIEAVKAQIAEYQEKARQGDQYAGRMVAALTGKEGVKGKDQRGTLYHLQKQEDYMRLAYEQQFGLEYKYRDRSKDNFSDKMDDMISSIKDNTKATSANTDQLKRNKPFNPAELARMRQTSQFQQELKDIVLASGAIQ